MMDKESKLIEADEKPLKSVYPDVQMRKQYANIKLSHCKLKNPVIIRIEPLLKYFKEKDKSKFITVLVEGVTPMAQINGYVHKRLKLSSNSALFLTCDGHIICNKKTICEISQKSAQDDGIVYIGYADQDPFG